MSDLAVHERHDPTNSTPGSIDRHRRRYLYAIELAKEYGADGGTWWDVACGYGYGTALLPAYKAFGVDREPVTVREAENRYPDCGFVVADVSHGGWAAALVGYDPDVIISIETLEHLDIFGQHALLSTAAAVLDGGLFVLACPLNDGTPSHNPWHKREPTEAQLRALLATHFGHILHFESEPYESTSGPAVQAFAVAR